MRRRSNLIWSIATDPDMESLASVLEGAGRNSLIDDDVMSVIWQLWSETPAVPLAQNTAELIAGNLRTELQDTARYPDKMLLDAGEALIAWIKQLRPSRFLEEAQDVPVLDTPAAAAAPAHTPAEDTEAAELAARAELMRMAEPVLQVQADIISRSRVVCQRLVVAANIGDVSEVICLVEGNVNANIGDVTIYAPMEADIRNSASIGKVTVVRLSYVQLLAMARGFRR